jgi:hypothetical protein
MKRIANLTLSAAAASLILAGLVMAQNRLYYFNGVPYVFPSSQGGAAQVLTNDGAGNLSWANPSSGEGLWTGSVVMSTIACPAGWTRLSAADARVIRGAATASGTGGADTHTHSISGSTAAQTVSTTGSTASSGVSISGSTGSTSISHTHSATPSTTGCTAGGGPSAITGVTINAGDAAHTHDSGTLSGAGHTHGSGTLAGASHSHGVGTLAAATASSLPAYYEVILCVKS